MPKTTSRVKQPRSSRHAMKEEWSFIPRDEDTQLCRPQSLSLRGCLESIHAFSCYSHTPTLVSSSTSTRRFEVMTEVTSCHTRGRPQNRSIQRVFAFDFGNHDQEE
ncbi:hypothetical protein CBOM_07901 [Ceraceosorus bombacis]|uniref:Uncharacterized protein n=1 Tax=Ceraceosorus bombacis TaxID=401625 RepID=A0A0P1BPU1_9BASI|nr:hypothetical protein CBOM_07901 [Ceraceosorus bombacis]